MPFRQRIEKVRHPAARRDPIRSGVSVERLLRPVFQKTHLVYVRRLICGMSLSLSARHDLSVVPENVSALKRRDEMAGIKDIAPNTDTGQVGLTMLLALAFGVAAVAASLASHGTVWHGLLWAGAWSSVGWFLGFLFGIPRYLSTDTARTPAAPSQESAKRELDAAVDEAKKLREAANNLPGDQAAEDAAKEAEAKADAAKTTLSGKEAAGTTPAGSSLTVNTNLEQISDWLTKIIIGVSLVESQSLLARMQDVATFMAKSMVKVGTTSDRSLKSAPSSMASAADVASSGVSSVTSIVSSPELFASIESFAYAVMLYFLATGLLGSYLLTRLFLQRALDDAAHGRPRAK
jgi:hypothetical protein